MYIDPYWREGSFSPFLTQFTFIFGFVFSRHCCANTDGLSSFLTKVIINPRQRPRAFLLTGINSTDG